jgi:repressor of nif and glnA expression
MSLKSPAKYELLKLIGSSKECLDTGAMIALANTKGLHVSARTIQNYLIDLERMNLIKLERIRKSQGHSQLIKPLNVPENLK